MSENTQNVKQKRKFFLWEDQVKTLLTLPPEKMGEAMACMFTAWDTGEMPEDADPFLRAFVKTILDSMQASDGKNAELSEMRREMGKRGGLAKANNAKQTLANSGKELANSGKGYQTLAYQDQDQDQDQDKNTPLTPHGGEGGGGELPYSPPMPKNPTPREQGTNARAVGTNPREQGRNPRAQGTNPRARPDPAPRYSGDFDAFWQAYPRKVGKDAAWKKWQQVHRRSDFPALPDLLASLERQRSSEQWQKEGGQFVPHAATWLNQGRWADEVQPADGRERADKYGNVIAPEMTLEEYERQKAERIKAIGF